MLGSVLGDIVPFDRISLLDVIVDKGWDRSTYLAAILGLPERMTVRIDNTQDFNRQLTEGSCFTTTIIAIVVSSIKYTTAYTR